MSQATKPTAFGKPPADYTISKILAALGSLAVVIIAFYTFITRTTSTGSTLLGGELSAVQVTQLYTQSGFWVLVTIGIVLAGYVYDHAQ